MRRLTTTLMIGLALVASGSATAWAQDQPLINARTMFEPSTAQPLFAVAKLSPGQAATAPATTSTTTMNNHQFGVGIRVSPSENGIGGGVRYFFYGGPLGVQAEVSTVGLDLADHDFDTVRFTPSVMYRFIEYKFDGPVSLTPYVGGGLSFVHSDFDEDIFGNMDDTTLGVLLFGGVEIFFVKVPNISVSGELRYVSNDDVDSPTFGSASVGGVRFTASGHWYFW